MLLPSHDDPSVTLKSLVCNTYSPGRTTATVRSDLGCLVSHLLKQKLLHPLRSSFNLLLERTTMTPPPCGTFPTAGGLGEKDGVRQSRDLTASARKDSPHQVLRLSMKKLGLELISR